MRTKHRIGYFSQPRAIAEITTMSEKMMKPLGTKKKAMPTWMKWPYRRVQILRVFGCRPAIRACR